MNVFPIAMVAIANGKKTAGVQSLVISSDGDTHTWTRTGTTDGVPDQEQITIWTRVHQGN